MNGRNAGRLSAERANNCNNRKGMRSMMKIDIIGALNEIAGNEHEKFKAFRERFIEYCTKENAVLELFRTLKGIELELNDCLTGRIRVNVERPIIVKVLKTIRTELEIIKYKMKYPLMVEFAVSKIPQPVEWEGDKIELVELIYAIYLVNKGKIALNSLRECFEFIFKVKLGNISDRFYREIAAR